MQAWDYDETGVYVGELVTWVGQCSVWMKCLWRFTSPLNKVTTSRCLRAHSDYLYKADEHRPLRVIARSVLHELMLNLRTDP